MVLRFCGVGHQQQLRTKEETPTIPRCLPTHIWPGLLLILTLLLTGCGFFDDLFGGGDDDDDEISDVFVFGDSISDTGNVFLATEDDVPVSAALCRALCHGGRVPQRAGAAGGGVRPGGGMKSVFTLPILSLPILVWIIAVRYAGKPLRILEKSDNPREA